MNVRSNIKRNKGQVLVELLIALSLAAIILPAILTGFVASREGKIQQTERMKAVTYNREAREALRFVRDSGWANVSTNGVYHPVASGTTWSLVAGPETIGGMTRSITIADTYRDTGGAITTTGGTLDPSTKKVTVSVSWNTLFPSSDTSVLYMARFENLSTSQSSEADFLAGTVDGTTVTNLRGGEVTLGAGGKGNWCMPTLSITALDLPKNGVANAVSAISGRIFAGTGDNSSGVSFANVNVSDTDPPTSNILGTLDGYKTNVVFGESNYAYLATDNNSKEVTIIDLTQLNPVTGKYAEAGYFNAPGNKAGASVTVSGNIGFVTDENTLYTFDLSSKSGSRPQLGSISLAAKGTKVVISGSYAFVSIAGAAQELQIVRFTDGGATLAITGFADVDSQSAYDVVVNSTGTRAYLATGADASRPEFFIIDTSSKNGNQPRVGSYDAVGMSPKALTIVPSNKAILVGHNAEEYQVINIENESVPVRCGGINIDTGVNGISSVVEADGDAYSYIITGDASTELKLIQGGPGGQFALSGSFESSIFDALVSSTFNRFESHVSLPTQTAVSYQVAVADAVSGGCTNATYTFVGPDMTETSYFATGSAIPVGVSGVYKNPGRCLRYKVIVEANDLYAAPYFEDITFNYSP